GSGQIKIEHLEAQALITHISGSGNVAAAGSARHQRISISGSGNHRAPELQSAAVDTQISGSGHASVWVTESLRAHLSGSGSVEYRGQPAVDSSISGSGHVRHVGGE
ncbi:MAG TPA: DUF2807 domain-containing protein, partial [Patescibacteria group bacterium]|nr:DUF2807 domain-containing protein [Patescibacteria group bacterium]